MSKYILLVRVKPYYGPSSNYVYPGAVFLVKRGPHLKGALYDIHGRHIGFSRNFIEYDSTDLEKVLCGIKD